jgi:CRISPR-associated exonuclease Cas4
LIDQTAFSITASDILEYLFCPRFIYFENYLDIPQHEEKRFKVQKGRDVHDDKQRINPAYLRKKLGCIERKSSVWSIFHLHKVSGELLMKFFFWMTGAPRRLITNMQSTRIELSKITNIS